MVLQLPLDAPLPPAPTAGEGAGAAKPKPKAKPKAGRAVKQEPSGAVEPTPPPRQQRVSPGWGQLTPLCVRLHAQTVHARPNHLALPAWPWAQRRRAASLPTSAAALADPAALVGQRVGVLWESERQYFFGTVAQWNEDEVSQGGGCNRASNGGLGRVGRGAAPQWHAASRYVLLCYSRCIRRHRLSSVLRCAVLPLPAGRALCQL